MPDVHVIVHPYHVPPGGINPGDARCEFVEIEDAGGRSLRFEREPAPGPGRPGYERIVIPTDEDPRVAQVRAVVAQAEASSLGIDGALQKIAGLVR